MTVTRPTFTSLTSRDAFIARHIGPSSEDQLAMLSVLNRATLDSLIADVVPKSIHSDTPLDLPSARSEPEVLAMMKILAGKNKVFKNYIGVCEW